MSNGTAAGTVLAKDIDPGSTGSSPNQLLNNNGTLFFLANDGTHGIEPWVATTGASGASNLAALGTAPAPEDVPAARLAGRSDSSAVQLPHDPTMTDPSVSPQRPEHSLPLASHAQGALHHLTPDDWLEAVM
jgi:hypothetical protein